MDKETLSHYGWIVILVLILAVMLALASPFGSFIAGAIKSTTAGLFNVNQAALGSAGIDVNDMVFENCDHLETEVRNVSDTYTGDTCCKACGAVLQAGQTVRPKVPDGGQYTAADGTVYGPGEEMPEVVTTGDTYTYQYYVYKYNQRAKYGGWETKESQNGWGVHVSTDIGSVRDYGEMLHTINGKPIVSLRYTFDNCTYMTTIPTIPDTVTDMGYTFYFCTALTDISNLVIPDGVTDMEGTFQFCKFTDASMIVIPSSVTTMNSAFLCCYNMTRLPNMSNATGLTNMTSTFSSCTSLTDISSTVLPPNVVNMERTFEQSTNLTKAPAIPSKVTNMLRTFYGCTALTAAPEISSSVSDMTWTFENCTSLKSVTNIPNSVTKLFATFRGCTALTGTITVDANPSSYESCFSGIDFESQNITLVGDSTKLDSLGTTGKNYCATCNGKCNGGH